MNASTANRVKTSCLCPDCQSLTPLTSSFLRPFSRELPTQDKQQGFLLFQAEKSKAAKARLSQALSATASTSFPSFSSTSEAEKAATAKIAGKKLVSRQYHCTASTSAWGAFVVVRVG